MTPTVTLLVAATVGVLEIAPVADRNAMTLPAQRHIVRMDAGSGRPAAWLLAIQKAGEEGHGLAFYRSNDEAKTWTYYADIQPDFTHTDRADLIAVGNDIALVWSFEAPDVLGSDRHDVYFQWWRFQPASGDWLPDPAVQVFDSTRSSEAYLRAELTRDSLGRIWVQAFKLEKGHFKAEISVSSDDGRTFLAQPTLDTLDERGGGRILSLGEKLLFVYDMHHDSANPARMRMREDGWPLEQWTEPQPAFAEGIYHGAALSAVDDGQGGMHLVYKEKLGMLLYRHFDGTKFADPVLLERDGNWAVQPAITRVGKTLYVFYNRVRSGERFDLVVRTLTGSGMSDATVVEDESSFKGYPAAVERLPDEIERVPCLFGLVTRSNRKSVIQIEIPHLAAGRPLQEGEPLLEPDTVLEGHWAQPADLFEPLLAPESAAPAESAPETSPEAGESDTEDHAVPAGTGCGCGDESSVPGVLVAATPLALALLARRRVRRAVRDLRS